MDKGNDCMDQLKSKYNDLGSSLKNRFESLKQEATDLGEKGKNKYENVKNDLQNNM